MKRILFFATIIAVALFNHPQAFTQEEATKPAYKTGDTWRFTAKSGGTTGSDPSRMLNGTYELSIVSGKLKIWAVTGSEKEELEPRPLPLLCLLGYCQNLDFPLTWASSGSVTITPRTLAVTNRFQGRLPMMLEE